ncbi:hypothetical protein, partial [Vandammella animalimorsus]|uniref:hypothetical protein n=1 Tax=Vandammella animalimorsus TaxID=2029117 RepID=UPI001EED3C98
PAQAGRSQPHETPAEVASKGQAVLSKGLRQICGLRDLSIQVVFFLLNKSIIFFALIFSLFLVMNLISNRIKKEIIFRENYFIYKGNNFLAKIPYMEIKQILLERKILTKRVIIKGDFFMSHKTISSHKISILSIEEQGNLNAEEIFNTIKSRMNEITNATKNNTALD